MQKTIYIPNPEIWKSMKQMAGKQSISGYLRDLHEANVESFKLLCERQEILREQLDIVSGIPDDFTLFGGTRGNED